MKTFRVTGKLRQPSSQQSQLWRNLERPRQILTLHCLNTGTPLVKEWREAQWNDSWTDSSYQLLIIMTTISCWLTKNVKSLITTREPKILQIQCVWVQSLQSNWRELQIDGGLFSRNSVVWGGYWRWCQISTEPSSFAETRESHNRSAVTRNLSLTKRLIPHGRSQKVSPSKQTERAAVVSAASEQQGAYHDPVTLQGQSEPSSQPIAVSEFPKTTRSGRVGIRPQYLKDFHTET